MSILLMHSVLNKYSPPETFPDFVLLQPVKWTYSHISHNTEVKGKIYTIIYPCFFDAAKFPVVYHQKGRD